jgi:hypothetical protein
LPTNRGGKTPQHHAHTLLSGDSEAGGA